MVLNKRGISKGVGYKHVVGNVGYSLRTTAEDYSKFIQALLNGTGLKPETAQFMLEPNRLICLFGCGGNRSKLRRFDMGEVSGKLADLTIITSDNPRFEHRHQL